MPATFPDCTGIYCNVEFAMGNVYKDLTSSRNTFEDEAEACKPVFAKVPSHADLH